jgi:hypothetical protein
MIAVVSGLVDGPFIGETPYKAAVIKQLSFLQHSYDWFCIETDQTEPGFPDTIRVSQVAPVLFVEFKCSDADGRIDFKKSQPLFYRKHLRYQILILAWDKRFNRTVLYTADEIVSMKTRSIVLPTKFEHSVEASCI